jgi:transglutaminase-like putative cysteine protease
LAANGLIYVALIRARKPEKIITLLLLFVLLTAAIAGVAGVLTGPDWGSLWSGLFFGLLLGWGLAIFQTPAWSSALITIFLGASYALVYAGGLGRKVSILLTELIFVLNRFNLNDQDPGVDFTQLAQPLMELVNTVGVILERVYTWVAALVMAEPTFDPVAVAFTWIVVVWIVAAWAGWVAIAYRNALLAVLPVILLSVGTLSYGQRISISLYLMLGLTLLLLATVQHDRREQEWDEIDTAYPPRKGRQIGNTAIIISIVIVLLAAIVSSISIPRILEWVSARGNPVARQDRGLAESLGIVTDVTITPDAFGDVRNPGLPRDKLIGSGPELSKRIVMTVAIEDYLPIFNGQHPQPLYWRDFTYDSYTGHGWRTSDTTQQQYQANQLLLTEPTPKHVSIEQIVRFVDRETKNVYAAGEPVAVNQPSDVAWRSPGDLFGILINEVNSYEARSVVPVVDEGSLRAEGQQYPDWVRKRFLALPSGVPDRVKELALHLTASEPTPYDRVRAIEQYMRTFPYTLDVPYPPLEQDLVDYFLFDLQKGYCDYYASAMVVLARAAGIPARFAVGYANGTYDLNAKRFLVSEADAHSWVEVYFPGSGWIPFEPTAGRPPLDRSRDIASADNSFLTLPDKPPSVAQSESLPLGWFLLLGLLASAGFIGSVWAAFDEIRMHKLSEPEAAAEVYQRLKRYGTHLAVITESGDTPYEFAALLRTNLQELSRLGANLVSEVHISEEILAITDRIVEISYKPIKYQNQSGNQIFQQWKGLRWWLRLMWLKKLYLLVQDRLRRTLRWGVNDIKAGVE